MMHAMIPWGLLLLGAEDREQAIPDLSGTWAEVQVTAVKVELPVLGEQRSKTMATLLLRVRQEGTRLVITEEVCELETVGSTKAIKTSYPPAFLRALSGLVREAELRRDSAWSYLEAGTLRTAGASVEVNAPLPTQADDPRVLDSDGDGHPGLTVEISGLIEGQVYVVQRGRSQLQANLHATDRLEGPLKFSSEEQVIGASHELLTKKPPTRPDPDESFFRRRRVPANATCAEVVARRPRLLGL